MQRSYYDLTKFETKLTRTTEFRVRWLRDFLGGKPKKPISCVVCIPVTRSRYSSFKALSAMQTFQKGLIWDINKLTHFTPIFINFNVFQDSTQLDSIQKLTSLCFNVFREYNFKITNHCFKFN